MSYYKTCSGCGAINESNKRFLKNIQHNQEYELCKRCFEIRFHNKLNETKLSLNWLAVLNKQTIEDNSIIYLVVSIDNILFASKIKNIIWLKKHKVILIVNKVDLFYKNIALTKIAKYVSVLIQHWELNIDTIILTAAKKNFGMDELYAAMKKNVETGIVNHYFIGVCNSGKTSIINKLIKNYDSNLYHQNINHLTASPYPATTLGFVKRVISNQEGKSINVIDSPGVVLGSFEMVIDYSKTSKEYLTKNNNIKAITYNIWEPKAIIYEGMAVASILPFKNKKINFHFYKNNHIQLHLSSINNISDYWNNHKNNFNVQLTLPFADFVNHKILIENNNLYTININGLGFFWFKEAQGTIINLQLPPSVEFIIQNEKNLFNF